MKKSTLEILAPLLDMLRSYEVLDEMHEARFYLDGRDFIHFHDDPDGLWADVRLAKGRVRLQVSSTPEQAELMEKISAKLDSLELNRNKMRRG